MFLKLDEEKGKTMIRGKLLLVVGFFKVVRKTCARLACIEETGLRSYN